MNHEYSEDAVETLDALTHIRRRSGMYIGRLGDGSHEEDGIYIMLKEVIDNSIDEWTMGFGSCIEVVQEGRRIVVKDQGRGIPLGRLVECVSQINTGAKYTQGAFQFSVGLNGVGLKAVNALSSLFKVMSYRNGKHAEAIFSRGILQTNQDPCFPEADLIAIQGSGTWVEFEPDETIFGVYQWHEGYILRRLRRYAYLNPGLTLLFNGQSLLSEHGLLDLLSEEQATPNYYPPLHYTSHELSFAFTHAEHYGEIELSFVNGQYTLDGGTHLVGFREGLIKALSHYGEETFYAADLREGFLAALAVKVQEPVFESQTKSKLSHVPTRTRIAQLTYDAMLLLLHQSPAIASKILERMRLNERLRRELNAVKQESLKRRRTSTFKIPKLRDSRHHRGQHPDSPTMIFLTEGESASASIVSTRDPLTQAVFSLKGKPLNVLGMDQSELYRHEGMFHLMQALGLEEGIEGLRYDQVILATDADVDGLHIRNLLITFFLHYFEPLVLKGHLYVLKAPLFKVRHRDTSYYCFTHEEKEKYLQTLKGGVEITRFKGLGELSPDEFRPFIHEQRQLQPISIDDLSQVQEALQFYMGRNTPERRQLIIDQLYLEESYETL